MVSQPHSDLEVVAPNDAGAHKYTYYAPTDNPPEIVPSAGTDTNKIAYESAESQTKGPQTTCGLRRRTFWVLLGVALVVVAAAVGGGVGGALASRSSSESSKNTSNSNSGSNSNSDSGSQTTQSRAQSSSTAPLSSSTPIPSSTVVISTSTIVGPSNSAVPTLLRDCPSSNDTLYTVTYGSTSYQYRKLCNNAYTNINGVATSIQGVFSTLNECIDKCASYNRNNATRIKAGTDPLCNSVCWRNTFDERNDWEGGHCFGFTTSNATVGGQTQFRVTNTGDICDSAALINQDF
ncbi:hypothetical protein E8E12_000774 [Didymella heteroderae]|uniref:Uncharacterized protein n=1 Tax=Didymella heteroderae TaxID=1769908 RepID=A0A9P4WHJ3_9PLEO|nr:hypothetical protein E8E12_000774 [Didymella heteroderae]